MDGAAPGGVLPRAHRFDRSTGSDAEVDSRDKPRRSGARRRARRGTAGAGSARAASRYSRVSERQRRNRRPDDHDGGLPGSRRLDPFGGLLRRCPAPPRGSPGARQNELERVGEFQVVALVEWLEQPRRTVQEPLRVESQPLRFELGYWCRDLGEPGSGRNRHGNGWLGRVPFERQRSRRDQAHRRPS